MTAVIPPHSPHPILIEPVVRTALLEDLGRAGDITTNTVVPNEVRLLGAIVSRQIGVIAGMDAAILAFRLLDPTIKITIERSDGSRVASGEVTIRLDGSARQSLRRSGSPLTFSVICQVSQRPPQPWSRWHANTARPKSSVRARQLRASGHLRNTPFPWAAGQIIVLVLMTLC